MVPIGMNPNRAFVPVDGFPRREEAIVDVAQERPSHSFHTFRRRAGIATFIPYFYVIMFF